MAGWDRNADCNRDVLEHIVALLFALANLAELAAGLPFRHRRQVLGILICGEAEAWAFVMGISTGAPAVADVPETASDAERLAASFRALALALCAVLARAALSAPRVAISSRAGRERPAGRARETAPHRIIRKPRPPPTSSPGAKVTFFYNGQGRRAAW